MNECHPVFSSKLQWNNFHCENPRCTLRIREDGLLALEILKLAPVPNFKCFSDTEQETAASSWWFLYFNNDHVVTVHFFLPLSYQQKHSAIHRTPQRKVMKIQQCVTSNGKKRIGEGICVSDSRLLLDSKYLFVILLGWYTVKTTDT